MTRFRPAAHLLLVATLGAALAGCGMSGASGKSGASGPSGTPPSWLSKAEPSSTPIPVLYRNRCGVCHRPVAPGTQPPDELHAELLLHRKRTRLTPQQWSGLEAFLAPSDPPPREAPSRSGAEDTAPPAR